MIIKSLKFWASLGVCALLAGAAQAAGKPNILFIVSDGTGGQLPLPTGN